MGAPSWVPDWRVGIGKECNGSTRLTTGIQGARGSHTLPLQDAGDTGPEVQVAGPQTGVLAKCGGIGYGADTRRYTGARYGKGFVQRGVGYRVRCQRGMRYGQSS